MPWATILPTTFGPGVRSVVDNIGVGLGPRNGIPEERRQAALDAAAVLQVRRSEIAATLAGGGHPGAQVVPAVSGLVGINLWMREASRAWRDVRSVRPAGTLAHLRTSVPHNRLLVETGLKMVSLFDYDGLEPAGRLLLAGESLGEYVLGVGPVQMKIVDRRYVILQGPFVDGESTLMTVTAPDCLELAWRYWAAALASSFPVADVVRGSAAELRELTSRQHQIVALLSDDTRDDAIASALGVSVRTVRSDIAGLMDALGVRSRFAAGLRLRELLGASRDLQPSATRVTGPGSDP